MKLGNPLPQVGTWKANRYRELILRHTSVMTDVHNPSVGRSLSGRNSPVRLPGWCFGFPVPGYLVAGLWKVC